MAVSTGPVYEVGAEYIEQLNYSNPLKRPVRPVWFQYERYFILDTDFEIFWNSPPDVSVKEYVFVYDDPNNPGCEVPGQFPVFSLVPGSFHYQPIAEVVEVQVPSSYQSNSLRSQSDILKTSYPVIETGHYYVRPIL